MRELIHQFVVKNIEYVLIGQKDKVDDSIMRVLSKEIASELMEITFGDNG